MRQLRRQFKKALGHLWRGLRQWCGDSAYETYLSSMRERQGSQVLSPAEFYVEQLDRKYSRPNRCC